MFLDEMIAKYNLVAVDETEKRAQWSSGRPGIPEWFVPGPISEYDVWRGMGTLRDAELFIDRETGEAHFTHMQL